MKKIYKQFKINFILSIILIFVLNSCYFTTNWYSNSSYYQHPNFKLDISDTLIISSLIHPDSNIRNYANQYFYNALNKFEKFKVIDASTTNNMLRMQKIYSLPYDLDDELITHLYDILQSKYLLIWYFSRLEESDIGKDAEVEIVIDIYDLFLKNKVWSCKSSLSLISPAPPEGSTYFYSLSTNKSSIGDIIDKVINKEFQKVVKNQF